jgi:hypothetical protein
MGGFPPRFSDSTTGANSTLSAELNSNAVHTPLIREYSLGIQYEFVHGWVLAGVFTTCVPTDPVPYGDLTATDYGITPIGAVHGPGQFNWDISVLKNTKVTERVNVQFRADFYNAFNHPQFVDPGFTSSILTRGFVNVTSPSTAHILYTNVNPRLIQFGLRFTF